MLPAHLSPPDWAAWRSPVSGGRAPRPSGCAQVCSNAFVWWSPPPPAACSQKAPRPGTLAPAARGARFWKPPRPRGGEGVRPTPARRRPWGHLRVAARPDYLSPSEPGRITCPRVPEPRASFGFCPGVCPRVPEPPRAPLLHAPRRPGVRSAQDARGWRRGGSAARSAGRAAAWAALRPRPLLIPAPADVRPVPEGSARGFN